MNKELNNIKNKMNEKPLVSIIIPTYNSAITLGKCLHSVTNQTYSNIEVIIVDNFSKDSTKKIANHYDIKIYEFGNERSAQRNYGIKKSNGAFVYCIDSDLVLEPTVIEECVEKCLNGYDAVSIMIKTKFEGNLWQRSIALEKIAYEQGVWLMPVEFIRKKDFLQIGGYDENLVAGEDYDLIIRLLQYFKIKEYKISAINGCVYDIGAPSDILMLAKKSLYYGKTIKNYLRKHPRTFFNLLPLRKPMIRKSNIYFQYPKEFLGLIILKIIQTIFNFIGFIFLKSSLPKTNPNTNREG